MAPQDGFSPGQGPRDVSKARTQGLILGLVLGVIIGGIAGALLPDMSQKPIPLPAKKAAAPALPAAPVSVSTRGDAGSKTLHIENTSDKELKGVSVRAFRGRTDETKTLDLGALAPKASKDIGAPDWDWKIAPEDSFDVTAAGFSATTYIEK